MLDIRPLSDKLQAKAISELHEVPSRLDKDIAALRVWVEMQPHLNARTSDQFLMIFLRGCKFSLEKAKEKIDHYYTLRTVYENVLTFRNVEDPRAKEIFGLGVFLMLPNPLGDDGPRIIMMRPGQYPPDKYSLSEIMRVQMSAQELMINEDDNIVVSGFIQIIDWAGATAAHLFQMNPSFMKKLGEFTEKGFPLRQHSAHLINTSSIFESFFNTLKKFMPDKAAYRMYVHGSNFEEMYKMVPQKYLPVEYGGENGSIPEIIDEWWTKIYANADYFKEDAQYRTDEKLRQDKAIDFDSLLGVEGSFRKLDFD